MNDSSKAEAEAHETGIRTQAGGAKYSNASTAGDRQKSPASFEINNHRYMQNHIREIKEKGLVPLRLDKKTVILVPPDKANEKYKARYLKNAERARRMALNLG